MILVSLFITPLTVSAADYASSFGGDTSLPEFLKESQFKANGTKGWYIMYSTEYNKGKGTFPVSTLKECVENEAGNYMPKKEDRPGENDGMWFGIKLGVGQINPDLNYTAAMKWVCTEPGRYRIMCDYWLGSWQDAPENDGVFFGVYDKNGKALSSAETTGYKSNIKQANTAHPTNPTQPKYQDEVDLKKGDCYYFVADPKLTGSCDSTAWWINFTKIDPDRPAASTATQTSSASTNTSSSAASANIANTESDSTESTESSEEPTDSQESDVSDDEYEEYYEVVSTTNKTPEKSSNFVLILLVSILGVAVLGMGGVMVYMFVIKPKKAMNVPQAEPKNDGE